mmetsp:Transcript_29469/g.94359  ORF Transcript_29469/g.94359 Transcript_29469/m.94359 type:complete len:356 (-) Transcript_29469:300-1367(-)
MATTVRLPIYGHGCGASPRRPSACRARVVVVLATQSPDSRGRGKRDNVSPPSAVNASGRGGATAMVPPPLELQQQRQRGGRGVAGMDMEGVLSSIDGCALEMQIPGAEHTLVLLRHGQSVWNLENRFTGWADIPLTEKGEDEATQAGKLMLERGFEFDVCYTSGLERAQHTADLCLANCYQHEIPTVHDWRLNERHYGALQGLVKDDPMLQRIYGEEQLVEWRRSYYERPPPMDPCHPLWAPPPVPETESLADCLLRVKQCWDDRIAPTVRSGKRVLVVAHANTIRALIKTVDGITDDDIRQVKIPNGAPIVYRLGKDLRPVDLADDLNFAGEYLVSPLNHRKVIDYPSPKGYAL